MLKKVYAFVFAAVALMVGLMSSAHAAIDVAETVAAIGEISVALLAVIGAFLAVSTAVLGLGKVWGFIKRKAGA